MDKNFECDACHRIFESVGSLRTHYRFCKVGTHIPIRKRVKNKRIGYKKSNYEWKCCICNSIFKTRREMQKHKKEIHPKYPKYPKCAWNKGLTKETSDIIKNAAYKISQSLIGKSSGVAKDLEKENKRRAKISIAISKRNELIQGGNGGRKDVKWFKIKNISGDEYIVRGTWELNVAKHLNELGILWLRNHRISYSNNGVVKQYNPDFYLPTSNEYIEVKGWFSDKDRLKMNFVIQQNPNVRIFFIDKNVYEDFIRDGKLNDSMLYMGD